MNRKNWSAKVRKLSILTAAILVCSILIFLNPSRSRRARTVTKTAVAEAVSAVISGQETENELSSALLMDSILSIIQSYYVDDDRVDNNSLLNLTMQSLEESNQIKITKEKDDFLATASGKSYRFKIPQNLHR